MARSLRHRMFRALVPTAVLALVGGGLTGCATTAEEPVVGGPCGAFARYAAQVGGVLPTDIDPDAVASGAGDAGDAGDAGGAGSTADATSMSAADGQVPGDVAPVSEDAAVEAAPEDEVGDAAPGEDSAVEEGGEPESVGDPGEAAPTDSGSSGDAADAGEPVAAPAPSTEQDAATTVAAGGTGSTAQIGRNGTVTIASTLTGVEGERFERSVARFEACTGIDVVHQGSDKLETELRERAAGTTDWDADLAIVPQPGLVADLVGQGALTPLPNSVGANVELGWDHAWSDAGTVDGTFYGAPVMASVKSFVWYSPEAFRKAGYEIPSTWSDIVSLTDRISDDHPDGSVTPWCLGVSDGDATGWVLSDWLEETLLSSGGTGGYDAWASHKIALDSSEAVDALDSVGSLLFTDGHVPGGREGVMSRTPREAGQQLTDGTCMMMLGSSSLETVIAEEPGVSGTADIASGAPGTPVAPTGAAGSTPAGTASPGESGRSGADMSAFVLPRAEDNDVATPVIAGGDYLVSLSHESGTSAAATAVMDYLTSAEWAQERVSLGGMATANRGVDAADAGSEATSRATQILQSRQSVIRLDASDSMPSGVGAGELWVALTSWGSGRVSSQAALTQAEDAWP